MRKKFVLLFIVAVNVFLLTGCWNYVEINGQINVSGIAVDIGRFGKKYHLSAEIITVSSKEKESVSASVVETESDTVFEGIRNLMTITTKKLYFGHCKAFVISEKAAKNGIGEILDMTIRNHELRIEVDVVIAKSGEARQVLLTEGIANPIMAYKIYDLMETSPKAVGGALTTKAYKVFNSIQSDGMSTVIPALEIRDAEDKKVLKFAGVAVFDKDKLVGYLDERQTKYLSFLNDKIGRSGLLTFKASEKPDLFLSYELYKNDTKRKMRFDGEVPSVEITVNTSVIIGEAEIQADFSKPEELEKARRLFEENMEKDLTELIYTAQAKLDCDILGLGSQMEKSNPKMWEKYKDNWNQTFKKLKINVKCKAAITGSGIDSSTMKK